MTGEKTIQSRNKIFGYKNVIIGTPCPCVREYYRVLMCNEINKLNSYIKMDNEGKDLTKEFMGCHQNKLEILSGLPVVGKLKK